MSHNDNIKIKFSGNDFFYVSSVLKADEHPDDARCSSLNNISDINSENCIKGIGYTSDIINKAHECENYILFRAFDISNDTEKNKIKPGNYAQFTDDGYFIIYDKDGTELKRYGNGLAYNTDADNKYYKGKAIITIRNGNKKIGFVFNASGSSNAIFRVDIPSEVLSSTLTFQDEIDKLKGDRKTNPNKYLNTMDKIDKDNSLYAADSSGYKYKITFTEEGNLVCLFKTIPENIENCMKDKYNINYNSATGSFWQDNSGNCYKKEICKNKSLAKEINNLENNHSGRDQNLINSKSIYSLELRRTISLSLGIIIIFGSIIYSKK